MLFSFLLAVIESHSLFGWICLAGLGGVGAVEIASQTASNQPSRAPAQRTEQGVNSHTIFDS